MRISIDIPDALFQKINSKAAQQSETLNDFLLRAATAELKPNNQKAPERKVIKLPLVKSKEASYVVSPEHLARIQEAEDIETSTRH